jgi:hypothetical protein
MSVHNVVFAESYEEIAADCDKYYDKDANKYINLLSPNNNCSTCNGGNAQLVLVKKGSDVLKYCLNSEGSTAFWNLMNNFMNNDGACSGAGQGLIFEAPNISGLNQISGIAKCGTCREKNTYALAYNDVKHQSGLAQVYDVYELNECVTCAGTDYQRYYAKDGECKPCPDGYRCDNEFSCDNLKNGAWGLNKCGLCVEDDYGKDGSSDCKKCSTSGKVSIETYTQSTTGREKRNNNKCIEKSECNTEGYGVNEEKNTCEECGTGKVSQADASGIYRCVENDPCASDTSCTNPGCGKGVGTQCQQCGDETPYSLTIPETTASNGQSVPAYNICVKEESYADCTNNVCTCKNGYGAQKPSRFNNNAYCPVCESNTYSNSDTNGKCLPCDGKLDIQNGLNVGCTACGANEQPNSNHTACVCKIGYGRDTENGVCRKCGGDEHPGETSVEDTEGYKCITYTSENDFGKVPDIVSDGNEKYYYKYKTCRNVKVAKYDNSRCVDICGNTGFNGETGYGRYKKDGLSQCVKCSDYGMTAKQKKQGDYSCELECDAYQVIQDGSCAYCSGEKYIYDTKEKKCINICENEYDNNNNLLKIAYSYVVDSHTVCTKCDDAYQDFINNACTPCASNQWFDADETTGSRCKSCPKNFACNGKTKIKCPFGTIAAEGSGNCSASGTTDTGFLYKNTDGKYEVVDEATYNEIHGEDYYKKFEYHDCGSVNGYPKSYNNDDIRVCQKCEDTERVINNSCVCGSTEKGAGQITDAVKEDGHGTVCQVCPSGYKKIEGSAYTCNTCSEDGKGFLWNGSTFDCAKCSGSTALYTDSNGLKWCLTYDELKRAFPKNQSDEYYVADTYYQENNVWTKCPAGSCCMNGGKHECVQGTYSWKGMACSGGAGNCYSCASTGKTTEGKGTKCEINNGNEEQQCKSKIRTICNTYIDANKFCITSKTNEKWCFDITKIPMSFNTIYNTKNIEPDAQITQY